MTLVNSSIYALRMANVCGDSNQNYNELAQPNHPTACYLINTIFLKTDPCGPFRRMK